MIPADALADDVIAADLVARREALGRGLRIWFPDDRTFETNDPAAFSKIASINEEIARRRRERAKALGLR